jgi:hypothetical protein
VQHQRDTGGGLDVLDALDVERLRDRHGHAVHDPDGDRQPVDTGLGDVGVVRLPVDLHVGVRDLAELGLHGDARDLHDVPGGADVLLERQVRAVVHHRAEAERDRLQRLLVRPGGEVRARTST